MYTYIICNNFEILAIPNFNAVMEIHKFHQEVLLVPPCLVFGPEERGAMVIPVWWNSGQLSGDLRLFSAS